MTPTEPASIALALTALALDVGGFLAPAAAGGAATAILGGFFLVSAISNVLYAVHARDGGHLAIELLSGLLHGVAGALLLANPSFARVAGGGIIAAALALNGIANVVGASFGRSRAHWAAKLVAGLVMLTSAAVIIAHWPASGKRVLGEVVGLSLLAGGASTLLLGWKARRGAGHATGLTPSHQGEGASG